MLMVDITIHILHSICIYHSICIHYTYTSSALVEQISSFNVITISDLYPQM